MKYHELSNLDKDKLRFQARSLITDIRIDINLPLTFSQKHSLNCRNYNIENDEEVTRIDKNGFVRICEYGIPCTYLCCGLADGKCKQIERKNGE